jgi:hypothetical protein
VAETRLTVTAPVHPATEACGQGASRGLCSLTGRVLTDPWRFVSAARAYRFADQDQA